jgi:hypothetical protein
MWNRALMVAGLVMMLLVNATEAGAQCFASAGNPIGGSVNLGVMQKNGLRMMSLYRYHYSAGYFNADVPYTGSNRPLSSANYNYAGLLLGYGITERLSGEMEMGYYFNKTQRYRLSDQTLRGYGLYQNPDNRFEVTGAAGVSIPFSRRFLRVGGVELPIDLQPSAASYGIVLQTYVIKENSFKSVRYFWVTRYEKHFRNPQGYVFGTLFNTSLFFSRHFVFGQGIAKDWTLILQGRYQWKDGNIRYDLPVAASGGQIVIIAPQINCSLHERWNLSLMFEKPVYQNYKGIQLGQNYAWVFTLSRDINLDQKQTNP